MQGEQRQESEDESLLNRHGEAAELTPKRKILDRKDASCSGGERRKDCSAGESIVQAKILLRPWPSQVPHLDQRDQARCTFPVGRYRFCCIAPGGIIESRSGNMDDVQMCQPDLLAHRDTFDSDPRGR
jgi:hypothetical protein